MGTIIRRVTLTVVAFILSYRVNIAFLLCEIWLWVMGILYNVKPMRTKDIPIIDVLSESLNNAIRLLLGWFIVVDIFLPPCSLILGYWLAGAFLMAIKRYAEYKMIDDPELAGQYRKSFRFYSEKSLLLSAFFYAMTSVLFIGIFLIKYRVELIVIMPFLIGLYCLYFYISFKEDSAVQKPEKLYKEKGLMLYCVVLIILFMVLMKIDIPDVRILTETDLVKLTWL